MNQRYWIVSDAEIKAVKFTVHHNKFHPEYLLRVKKNVQKSEVDLSKEFVWNCILRSLLSSQQKSGENSLIRKFLESNSFPFSYNYCLKNRKHLASLVSKRLSKEGIRFGNNIGHQLFENLNTLEAGFW